MEAMSMSTLYSHLRHYRTMILLAALLVIALAALATSGSAWTTEDIEPGEGDYLSAYIYVVGTDHRRAESVSASYTAMQITSTTRAYMSYPRSHLGERTAIESASITFIARSPVGGTVDVKVMKGEIHEIVPGLAYQRILNAPSAGTVIVPDGGPVRTYTVSITGDALDVLRAAVAEGNEYLVIGFHLTGSGGVDIYARYVDSSGTHYSTLKLEYDDEAPDVPTPDPLDPYVAGDHLPACTFPGLPRITPTTPAPGSRGPHGTSPASLTTRTTPSASAPATARASSRTGPPPSARRWTAPHLRSPFLWISTSTR
jgi:hypothetical protein